MGNPEQFKKHETDEGGNIESARTEYDILTEVEPFDKKQAKENVEEAKQQIEQEQSQEKILDPRVESLAIPLARDYIEKNKDQKESQSTETKLDYGREIRDRLDEAFGEGWWLRKQRRTPEETEKINEIVSQVISSIEGADEANRFIEEEPNRAIGHLRELTEKGADPLQIAESFHGFNPSIAEELTEMGFSLEDMVNRMNEDRAEEWRSFLIENNVDPDIINSKLSKQTLKYIERNEKKQKRANPIKNLFRH